MFIFSIYCLTCRDVSHYDDSDRLTLIERIPTDASKAKGLDASSLRFEYGNAGQIVWQADYTAWGEIDLYRIHQFDQPLRFQGQYADDETGLYYTTFRYYDPHAGKFTTQYPIGLADGWNLYQYAPNPLNWIDPLGLAKNPPKKNKPTKAELDAMSKAVNDILDGKGMPRLDRLGNQKVFGGVLESGQKVNKWKGGLEWDVVQGNNRLRIITKELPNGQTQVGFGHPHWERIFDILVKNE